MPRIKPAIRPAARLSVFFGLTGVVFGWACVATASVGSGPARTSSSSAMSAFDAALPAARSWARRSSTRRAARRVRTAIVASANAFAIAAASSGVPAFAVTETMLLSATGVDLDVREQLLRGSLRPRGRP